MSLLSKPNRIPIVYSAFQASPTFKTESPVYQSLFNPMFTESLFNRMVQQVN